MGTASETLRKYSGYLAGFIIILIIVVFIELQRTQPSHILITWWNWIVLNVMTPARDFFDGYYMGLSYVAVLTIFMVLYIAVPKLWGKKEVIKETVVQKTQATAQKVSSVVPTATTSNPNPTPTASNPTPSETLEEQAKEAEAAAT